MKNKSATLLLALFLHLLLWKADLGLNLLLFALTSTLVIRWLKPKLYARRQLRLLLAAWCFTGLCVMVHHSNLSYYVYWLACFITMGYLQEERVNFWLFGLAESFRALFFGWLVSIKKLNKTWQAPPHLSQIAPLLKLRLLLVPLLIITPFYLLYSQANTAFSALNERILSSFDYLFQLNINWPRIWIFCLCWILVIALLGKRQGFTGLHRISRSWGFDLQRRRTTFLPFFALFNIHSKGILGLKREFQLAIITFVALNTLLVIINILDLSLVWFNWEPRSASELSQFVHSGTWLLILSIVLAMLVVLVFLRGNLNFMDQAPRLRQLVYLWLGQNVFLALSVGIRNGHYIHQYALAHGRIVVAFFLVLVLFGLYTMYLKIKGPKTTFYLLQTNGTAVFLALLVAVAFNWDNLITRYNLTYATSDNYHLIYKLDNNLIPLLEHCAENNTQSISEEHIKYRENKLLSQLQQQDWRGWNWSNYRQYRALQTYLENKK